MTLADAVRRLRAVLPDRWFADDAPNLITLLRGLAQGWVDLWALLAAVQRQARLLTVDGPFLDLAARDYRGGDFLRRKGESDTLFRRRLLPIFRDRVTRAAVMTRLRELGCGNVSVFEPTRPADTGGYGRACGYGVGGRYGSLSIPAQFFVQANRPLGQGIPRVAGYGTPAGGYGRGVIAYSRLADEAAHVTDQDIYDAISDTKPAGTVAWTALGGVPTGGAVELDEFVLGVNSLTD